MSFHEEAGKGSWKRPSEVSKETYSDNWDAIFGKKQLSIEEKWEVFEKNKRENFVASTLLEKDVCPTCLGKLGIWDCGWYYECFTCKK
jgi:hypothetical protein